MAAGPLIGASLTRREDARVLRGETRYLDDIDRPGAVHAAFVRSPLAHAAIRAIAVPERADGLVAVLVPKFTNRFVVRWFVPLLARHDVTVRLDAEGSFVWDRCDGGTTVQAIAEQLHARLGGDEAAVGERVGRFVAKLAHASLVTMDTPGEQQ